MTAFKKVLIIFAITLIALFIDLPHEIPVKINIGPVNIDKTVTRPNLDFTLGRFSVKRNFDLVLGLDLAGGSHMVFEADLSGIEDSKKEIALKGVRDVIERRVNFFGVSEPSVFLSSFEGKDRIIVELPGIKDTSQAAQLIGQTAQLVFVESGTEDEPGLVPTDLTGADLKSAETVFDRTTGKPAISLSFTDEGAKKFADITGRNVGKPLAIYLDGVQLSAPVVQEKITQGNAQISGDFTLEQARNLTVQLNAGALPVPVKLIEQRVVGATLGTESVARSIRAGVVGLAMVLIFMVLAYGKFGVMADIALVVFGVITFALYKLFPVVLTLPGIAGFMLSVGMAVDSNILIFERFKEEKYKRSFSDAMEVSFGRAWDSIRDANVATLLSAFVLANPLDFGFLQVSGPVRGFAITLALGIGISLFTGIIVSRNLMRAFLKEVKK
jgi:preprotein translocase subunit SecD